MVLIICQFVFSEEIIRRDGFPDVTGTILSGDDDGLLLNVETGNSVRLPWSTIDFILPKQPRPRLQQFIEEGKQLWRAKRRLSRGDIQLSEAIFAQQFNRLFGLHGADARLASEGYLRILVSKGLLQQAVKPWLETVRLHLENEPSPFSHLQPIIDEQTLLCPHLPIFEVDVSTRTKIVSDTSSKIKSLRSLTELLCKNVINITPTDQIQDVQQPFFLAQIMLATKGNQDAIQSLSNTMDELLPWQKVWAHYAIGKGYLLSKDEVIRKKGLLHLAHASSANPSLQPWLSGAAMLQMSNELSAEGLKQQADRIQHEAIRLFPTHPLIISFKER